MSNDDLVRDLREAAFAIAMSGASDDIQLSKRLTAHADRLSTTIEEPPRYATGRELLAMFREEVAKNPSAWTQEKFDALLERVQGIRDNGAPAAPQPSTTEEPHESTGDDANVDRLLRIGAIEHELATCPEPRRPHLLRERDALLKATEEPHESTGGDPWALPEGWEYRVGTEAMDNAGEWWAVRTSGPPLNAWHAERERAEAEATVAKRNREDPPTTSNAAGETPEAARPGSTSGSERTGETAGTPPTSVISSSSPAAAEPPGVPTEPGWWWQDVANIYGHRGQRLVAAHVNRGEDGVLRVDGSPDSVTHPFFVWRGRCYTQSDIDNATAEVRRAVAEGLRERSRELATTVARREDDDDLSEISGSYSFASRLFREFADKIDPPRPVGEETA